MVLGVSGNSELSKAECTTLRTLEDNIVYYTTIHVYSLKTRN